MSIQHILSVGLTQIVFGLVITANAVGGFPYKAEIVKCEKRPLRAELHAQSTTIKLQKSPPATIYQLRRRADRDVGSMAAVLQSHGYYDGIIEYSINTNKSPASVKFKPILNERYLLRDLKVEYADIPSGDSKPIVPKILLKMGVPAVASTVEFEELRLLRSVKGKGYPFAKSSKSRITIDKKNKRVDIVFVIELGKIATFGSTDVSGEDSIKSSYLYRRIPWKRGDLYNLKDVTDLEQDLLVSGLFNIAKVYHTPLTDPDGSLPMKIEVLERKHRTIRVGANYRSDIGAGGVISWEHRNLFSGAESLGLTLAISEIETSQNIHFKRPDFLTPDLALLASIEVLQDDPHAYSSKSYEATTTLEYKLSRHFTTSIGLTYKESSVEQLESDENYTLLGAPLFFERDSRDNELDSSEGWRGIFLVEPVSDLKNDSGFVRYVTEERAYVLISQKRSFILAGRVLAGSISGADHDEIPADERFYAGGGGSVRGYEYQTVGTITTNGIPTGGLSLFELSAEARINIGEKLGYVLFVDGGMAFDNRLFESSESILWGAGMGIRYNIGFAPLRVDFAVPLNKRDIDNSFQFYVSIGQAF